ncbi:PP2C family protein-serine/threonine phosphatase [Acetobacterium bakii]|uniref:PP2C family protein-serine/threonine phosphatase n=1 Tax=Acetobacterium bakii TaxID=52689 RepID=UPI000680C8E2|nr:PP2C family protein-serine/threonine phosphatase [Acetobacterium bakii]
MANNDAAMNNQIFIENEDKANQYAAKCLIIIAAIVGIVWILNSINFFIISKILMNIAMPISIVLFLLPSLLIKAIGGQKWYLKYLIMACTILGITILSTMMTLHTVLAWICPILISCHYYSKKFTGWTLAGSVVFMTIAIFTGLYIGLWDSNMMLVMDGVQERVITGSILTRTLKFYYLPRVFTLVALSPICFTLVNRTRELLNKQKKDSEEKQRISAELNVATEIQISMLPSIFPAFTDIAEIDIFATMQPAKEVGGDFYDFFSIDNDHLAVVIADVSGKGVPAALFMVVAKTLIKNHTQAGLTPVEVFTLVNTQLCENNDVGMFVTAWMGVLEISTRNFICVNAGHNPPLLKKAAGCFEYLKLASGFVLGGMEDIKYQQVEMQLTNGDELYLYTDGVTEATNTNNGLYGEERLLSVLNSNTKLNPNELLSTIKKDIDSFVNGAPQFDDITMVAFKINEA